MSCGALLSNRAVNLRFPFSVNVGTPPANFELRGEDYYMFFE